MPRLPVPRQNSALVSPLQVQRQLDLYRLNLSEPNAGEGASLLGASGGTVQEALESLASGTSGSAIRWAVGTAWADIETQLASTSGMAVVLVEADTTLGHRLMTASLSGSTDLSRVVFVGVTQGDGSVPYPGPVEVWFESGFQLGFGGVLTSKNIHWRHAASIAGQTLPTMCIAWEFHGGGMSPQPGVTVEAATVDQPHPGSIVLREGAFLDGSGYGLGADALISAVGRVGHPLEPAVGLLATDGSWIGPHAFKNTVNPTTNTFSADGTVTLDPNMVVPGDPFNVTMNYLDQALMGVTIDTPADWGGDPATVAEAVNRLAAAVAVWIGGPIP